MTKEYMKKSAKELKGYLEMVTTFFHIDGLTPEEYENAIATTKKLIKKLKKGDRDVFDAKRLAEKEDEGMLDMDV